MSDNTRAIEMAVEVAGTPEEVWQAIASGPGISSWYVPHEVEEATGGAMTASFGPGMDVNGRVAVWDPPNRVVFDGGGADGGMAFEWLVEAASGSTCIVRLVNSGFGEGAEWDAQFDAMEGGWRLFLFNLQLHREHFAGQTAVAGLPMAVFDCSGAEAWKRLSVAFSVPVGAIVGDSIAIDAGNGARLVGTVANVGEANLALVVEEPAPGTAFLAAEEVGGSTSVSVWSYLYGTEAQSIIDADTPRWAEALSALAES